MLNCSAGLQNVTLRDRAEHDKMPTCICREYRRISSGPGATSTKLPIKPSALRHVLSLALAPLFTGPGSSRVQRRHEQQLCSQSLKPLILFQQTWSPLKWAKKHGVVARESASHRPSSLRALSSLQFREDCHCWWPCPCHHWSLAKGRANIHLPLLGGDFRESVHH